MHISHTTYVFRINFIRRWRYAKKTLHNKIRHRVIEIINGHLDLPTIEDNGVNYFIREPT